KVFQQRVSNPLKIALARDIRLVADGVIPFAAYPSRHRGRFGGGEVHEDWDSPIACDCSCVMSTQGTCSPCDQGDAAGKIKDSLRVSHVLLVCPPSAVTRAPVMKPARCEQRKTTTSAISSGVPNRPRGTSASRYRRTCSGSIAIF